MTTTAPFRDIYDWRPQIDENASRQPSRFPEIRDERFWRLYNAAKAYSMLDVPGFFNLYQSVLYVAANRVPGSLVECGSFLGGASIFMTALARELGDDRPIEVYDTFAGFPEGQTDVRRGVGEVRGPRYQSFFDSVRANFDTVLGTAHGVALIEGDVAETLPVRSRKPIALLRLDTDYYPSTRAEFEHLYPLLSPGGVLIVDDYGVYEGSRRATDEYMAGKARPPLLNRITPGIWAGVKP